VPRLRAVLVACFSVAGCAHASANGRLSASAAVARAEEFIRVNGYTKAPLSPLHELTPESLEFWGPDEMATHRHDSLQPQAYGYAKGRRGPNGATGWTVVFCPTRSDGDEKRATGRAVTMNEDGANMRVEHVDFFLDAVDKRLRRCAE